MFGTNQIYGRSAFNAQEDKLLVTSMFLTLQGEGPYQGRPALFIRLAFCNLNCKFCDTFFDQGDWFTISELVSKSLDMITSKYKKMEDCGIVITGGEPSLQQNIAKFLSSYQFVSLSFLQIESNGILPFDNLSNKVTLVISPKCSEKTGKYLMPNENSLQRADCLKFVVSSEKDSSYSKIPDWAFEWKQLTGDIIFVSPMNIYKESFLEMARNRVQERKEHNIDYRSTVDEVVSGWDDTILDREKNRINHAYAAKYALENGLFLTLQMHLYAQIA